MERKRTISGANAKLKGLKELLSSTISVNHGSRSRDSATSSSGSTTFRNRGKTSVSLFNLFDTRSSSSGFGTSERPVSVALTSGEAGGFDSCESKSVSMYGLVEPGEVGATAVSHPTQQHSKNPALRLYYSIRSKLRKRRRDRNKVVDSKCTDLGFERNRSSSLSSGRFHLQPSQSEDNIESFTTPIGYRDECQTNESEYGGSPNLPQRVQNSPPCIKAVPLPATPKTKCLTNELCDLLYYGWYWGGLSKEEAEEKLKGQDDGAFIVRDSSSDHYLLSLSFNSHGRTLHTRIEYRSGEFRFYSSEADSFPTVAELIEHCITNSEGGVFCNTKSKRSNHPSYPVRLTKPISRFTEVKTLKYLSRFVIRKHVRVDLLSQLPLPPTLIEYVAEQKYI